MVEVNPEDPAFKDPTKFIGNAVPNHSDKLRPAGAQPHPQPGRQCPATCARNVQVGPVATPTSQSRHVPTFCRSKRLPCASHSFASEPEENWTDKAERKPVTSQPALLAKRGVFFLPARHPPATNRAEAYGGHGVFCA